MDMVPEQGGSFPPLRPASRSSTDSFLSFALGLVFMLVIPLLNCRNVRVSAPVIGDAIEAAALKDSPNDWKWVTSEGQERNLASTRALLHGAMAIHGISRLSVALKQGARWSGGARVYSLDLIGPNSGAQAQSIDDFQYLTHRMGQPIISYIALKMADLEQWKVRQPFIRLLSDSDLDLPFFLELKKNPLWNRVTIQDLLSHQSGIIDGMETGVSRLPRMIEDPGHSFRFADNNFRLLRFLIEKKRGQTLAKAADELVWRPFGIPRTRFIENLAIGSSPDDGIPTLPTLETNAADFTRLLWLLRTSGFELSHEAFMSHIIWPSVSIHSSVIDDRGGSSRTQVSPKGLSWCLGWGQYKLPRVQLGICSFMGAHEGTTAAYAMAYESRNSTVLTIFSDGKAPARIIETVIRECLGDIQTPLKWLDLF